MAMASSKPSFSVSVNSSLLRRKVTLFWLEVTVTGAPVLTTISPALLTMPMTMAPVLFTAASWAFFAQANAMDTFTAASPTAALKSAA